MTGNRASGRNYNPALRFARQLPATHFCCYFSPTVLFYMLQMSWFSSSKRLVGVFLWLPLQFTPLVVNLTASPRWIINGLEAKKKRLNRRIFLPLWFFLSPRSFPATPDATTQFNSCFTVNWSSLTTFRNQSNRSWLCSSITPSNWLIAKSNQSFISISLERKKRPHTGHILLHSWDHWVVIYFPN